MDKFFYTSKKQSSKLRPNYYASGVLDIDYELLHQHGIRCIAFDVDGTITKSGSSSMAAKQSLRLVAIIENAGIEKALLASNSERDLSTIINQLPGFTAVQPHNHAPKPSKSFYQAVIDTAGCRPEQIAMVGDRYLQDIWGAKRSGLSAILIAMQPNHASNLDKMLFRDKWQYRVTKYLAKKHKT